MSTKCAVVFCTVLAAVCCFGKIEFQDNGYIEAAGFKIRTTCVNKQWSWRDNGKLKDINPARGARRFVTSGTCKMNGSNVDMKMDAVLQKDGFYKIESKFPGRLPLLVRNAKTTVTLNIPSNGVTVYAISADGARLGDVKGRKTDKKITFTANTAMFKQGVMAYEIIRK